MSENQVELQSFIEEWQEDDCKSKASFLYLKNFLESLPDVLVDFKPRPGVTYSLRGGHPRLTKKPLFTMIDVIEGEPRWLSICFYAEMIADPDEKGDFVPGGLLGEDGHCFDIEEYNEKAIKYVAQRIQEAYDKAAVL